MKKIIISIIVIGLLLITSIASANAFNNRDLYIKKEPSGPPATHDSYVDIYVDDDNTEGPWDGTKEHPFQKIQQGINAVFDNGTVFVLSGTYYENIVIKNKGVDLRGENRETTIINGMNLGAPLWIRSSFVTLNGFTVTNAVEDMFGASIHVVHKRWLYPNETRVYLKNIKIFNCIVEDNNSTGIGLTRTKIVEITNCILHDNPTGIGAFDSSQVNISQCTIYNNGWISGAMASIGGIGLDTNREIKISNCVIRDNKVIGISIGYGGGGSVEVYNNIINHNKYFGIHVSRVTNHPSLEVLIHDNEIIGNGMESMGKSCGIFLSDCSLKKLIIKNNVISSNIMRGIYFLRTSNAQIMNNNISKNTIFGIFLEIGTNNTIIKNNISENYDTGLYLYSDCQDNVIYHNNFINNPFSNAYDHGFANIWDNGYPSGGNYWSDYKGWDLNPRDGIGDTPYNIPGVYDNEDRYPLMKPVGSSSKSYQSSQSLTQGSPTNN